MFDIFKTWGYDLVIALRLPETVRLQQDKPIQAYLVVCIMLLWVDLCSFMGISQTLVIGHELKLQGVAITGKVLLLKFENLVFHISSIYL